MGDVALPRVDFDVAAKAVYLCLQEKNHGLALVQTEGGGVDVDRNPYDASDIYGVEMLTAPTGDDSLNLPASLWVLITQAWERATNIMTAGRKFGLLYGSFPLDGHRTLAEELRRAGCVELLS